MEKFWTIFIIITIVVIMARIFGDKIIKSFVFQLWVVKTQVENDEPFTREVRGSKKSMISVAREKATKVVVNNTANGFIISCIVKGKKVTMEHISR